MRPWTHSQIALLRLCLAERRPMASICAVFTTAHDRDEAVEAIDACRRYARDAAAVAHVNQVLAYRAAGLPLVNGRPVQRAGWRRLAEPMFP